MNLRAAAERYREDILRRPSEASGYVELAALKLQQAEAGGVELELVPEALELVRRALSLQPENYEARLVHGRLLNKLHRFDEARILAAGLIDENPHVASSHEILVDALVELGRYEEAVAASDRLAGLRPGLSAYARIAYLRELHGDSDGALEAMTMAANSGRWGSAQRAWAMMEVGNLLLGANRIDDAASVYRGILDERPDYTAAVAGLAQCALASGRYAEALVLIDMALEVERDVGYLEIRMEVSNAMGRDDEASRIANEIAGIFDQLGAMGEVVDMEKADFLVDQGTELDEALERAERSYRGRPGHLHSLETYAWALHAAGRSAEATDYIVRAMRLGTGDAMVYYRAGMIFIGAGRKDEGRDFLSKALDAHLHVESPTAAREAHLLLETPLAG